MRGEFTVVSGENGEMPSKRYAGVLIDVRILFHNPRFFFN